jgi:hypothetical protein
VKWRPKQISSFLGNFSLTRSSARQTTPSTLFAAPLHAGGHVEHPALTYSANVHSVNTTGGTTNEQTTQNQIRDVEWLLIAVCAAGVLRHIAVGRVGAPIRAAVAALVAAYRNAGSVRPSRTAQRPSTSSPQSSQQTGPGSKAATPTASSLQVSC